MEIKNKMLHKNFKIKKQKIKYYTKIIKCKI